MVLRAARIALFAFLLVGVLAAPAAAQANETATQTPAEAEEPTYVASVSSTLRVVDYELQGETMVVELESDRPQLVSTSDLAGSVSESGGAVEWSPDRTTIPKGTTELRVPAGRWNGMAVVTIANSDGAVTISERASSPLIGGPWTAGDARAAGAGVLVTSIALTGVLGVRKVQGVGSDIRRLI